MKRVIIYLLFASLCLLIGCSASSPSPEPYIIDPDEIATLVMATMDARQLSSADQGPASTPIPDKLPHSLYFLSDRSGIDQVWRIERNGVNISQITFSESAVIAFDIHPNDGALVYVNKSQLLVQSMSNSEPVLLHSIEIEDPSPLLGKQFANPRFSPDGMQIAFALNGLNILDVPSGESRLLIENSYVELDSGASIPRELYFPESFSPDGKYLLISTAFIEGGSLSFLNLQSLEKIDFQSSGIVCCQSIWAQDSQSVLVASPYLGLVDSGLWQYQLKDGAEVSLILSGGSDASLNFVGWPFQFENGDLQFFYSRSTGLPEGDVPLFMVKAELNTLDHPKSLREDAFLLQEALWAIDGSLAIVIPTLQGRPGPLVIAHSDGRSLEILFEGARMLRWGP